MDQGTRNHLTLVEALAYGALALIVAIGFYIASWDEAVFRNVYVREDGVLETGTALILLIAAGVVFVRFIRERAAHTWHFSALSLFIVFILIFGAGEEVSWGQRIFNIESGDFFEANNRQGETNLHNLSVYGVNLNKAFARTSALFIIVFYLILPYFYARRGRIHGLMNRFYIPVPKIHQGLVILALAIIIDQIPSSKRGELNEVTVSLFILLLVTYAQNIRHGRLR